MMGFIVLFGAATLARMAQATNSCDLLLRSTPRSFTIGMHHPNIFVLDEPGGLYAYKADVETLADDLRLADAVFTGSESKIFRVNPVLDEAEVPNDRVPEDVIPERTKAFFAEHFRGGKALVCRSKYLSGQIPPYAVEEVKRVDQKRILEESRVFQAELDRIFNWVRRTRPIFEGSEIEASVCVDIILFKPEWRKERQESYGTRLLSIGAGKYSASISYGMNFIVRDNLFILIDPS